MHSSQYAWMASTCTPRSSRSTRSAEREGGRHQAGQRVAQVGGRKEGEGQEQRESEVEGEAVGGHGQPGEGRPAGCGRRPRSRSSGRRRRPGSPWTRPRSPRGAARGERRTPPPRRGTGTAPPRSSSTRSIPLSTSEATNLADGRTARNVARRTRRPRMESMSPRPSVVIVGGGFAGLAAARALARAPVDVTLVDRRTTTSSSRSSTRWRRRACPRPTSPPDPPHPAPAAERPRAPRPRRSRSFPRRSAFASADGELPYDHLDPRRRRRPLLLRERRLGARTRRASRRSRTRSRSAGACCSPSRRPSGRRTPRPGAVAHLRGGRRRARPGSRWPGPSPRSRATRSPATSAASTPAPRASSSSRRGPRVLLVLSRGALGEGDSCSSRRSGCRSGRARPVTGARRGRGAGRRRADRRPHRGVGGRGRGLAARALARGAARPGRSRAGRAPT